MQSCVNSLLGARKFCKLLKQSCIMDLDLRKTPSMCEPCWGKLRKTIFSIVSPEAEIRTEDLPNTKQWGYIPSFNAVCISVGERSMSIRYPVTTPLSLHLGYWLFWQQEGRVTYYWLHSNNFIDSFLPTWCNDRTDQTRTSVKTVIVDTNYCPFIRFISMVKFQFLGLHLRYNQ